MYKGKHYQDFDLSEASIIYPPVKSIDASNFMFPLYQVIIQDKHKALLRFISGRFIFYFLDDKIPEINPDYKFSFQTILGIPDLILMDPKREYTRLPTVEIDRDEIEFMNKFYGRYTPLS